MSATAPQAPNRARLHSTALPPTSLTPGNSRTAFRSGGFESEWTENARDRLVDQRRRSRNVNARLQRPSQAGCASCVEIPCRPFRRALSPKRGNQLSPSISARWGRQISPTTTRRRAEFSQGNLSHAEAIPKSSDQSSTSGAQSVREERWYESSVMEHREAEAEPSKDRERLSTFDNPLLDKETDPPSHSRPLPRHSLNPHHASPPLSRLPSHLSSTERHNSRLDRNSTLLPSTPLLLPLRPFHIQPLQNVLSCPMEPLSPRTTSQELPFPTTLLLPLPIRRSPLQPKARM